MSVQTVDQYLMLNQKYFPEDKVALLRERLYALDEQQLSTLYAINLKDPVVLLIVSIFVGGLGIDRFLIENIGMGILKLLTGGLFGILTIIDWFLIMGKTREQNFQKIMMLT